MREPTIAGVIIGFLILLVLFRLLEFTRPRDRRMRLLRPGFGVDLAWFAFMPLVTKFVTRIAVILALLPVALLIHGKVDPQIIQSGYGPASRLPLWIQAVAILIISDFFSYWMHRLFHGRRLWNFHAVHHSSRQLDWLSSVRVQPVNDLLMKIVSVIPLVAAGFSPLAVAALLPLLTVFAVMLHANLDWDFGPLRWLIASPAFHRWHHTDELEARDKNFAGLFPLWDILFGTWYMPRDRSPANFGTNSPVPQGLIGQLLFPFRHKD